MQSYWSSNFLFPAVALKELKSTFCRFLWKGPSLLKSGAKVAWSRISLPPSEGGLGVKQLDEWNKASMLLHLWNIINLESPSLWAKWVQTYALKDKQFWCMDIPNDCSWIWQKVLALRSCAMQHTNFIIGNGNRTNLWFDP